jgi:UDP-glucose 4-epimerase
MTSICLVLGGSGFIGSHLVRCLAQSDTQVRVFDRDYENYQQNIGNLKAVEFYQGDIEDATTLKQALVDVNSVVYLIHSTVPASSMQDLTFDVTSNVLPLIKFLSAVRMHKSIERLIYVSSGGTVYGNPDKMQPISENCETKPISSYGLTKLVCEHYVRLCLSDSHIKSYIARPSNAYGPNQNFSHNQGVVGVFLRHLIANKSITVFGDGGVVRDFIYVRDLVAGLRKCLVDSDNSTGQVLTLNFGTGVGVTLMQLIEVIETIVGREFTINKQPDRGFDCHYNVLDVSKAFQVLGWQPRMSLEDGILKTWEWLLSEYGSATTT